MSKKILKTWLITSVYFYIFSLISHLKMPFENTDVAYTMNSIHLSLFIFSFSIATLLTLWQLLLPTLNKHFKLSVSCLMMTTVILIFMTNGHYESSFHIAILFIILFIQLYQYNQLNKTLIDKDKKNNYNTKDKSWLFLIVILIVIFYLIWFTSIKNEDVAYYQDIFPTQDEIKEMYQLNDVNVEESPYDENAIDYYFSDFYITSIYCTLEIKNTTYVNTPMLKHYEEVCDEEFERIETGVDDLRLYLNEYEDQTQETGSLFALFETEEYKVYFIAYLDANVDIDHSIFARDIYLFFGEMRS